MSEVYKDWGIYDLKFAWEPDISGLQGKKGRRKKDNSLTRHLDQDRFKRMI